MKRYLHLFTALALLVVAVSNAHATQTGETTLGYMLEDPSHRSVTASDKRFDSWFVAGDTDRVNPFDIGITALHDGGLDPGPGLQFSVINNALSVFGDDSINYTIGFRVTVLDPLLRVKDNSLAFRAGGAFLARISDGDNEVGISIEERVGTGPGLNDLGVKNIEFSVLDDVDTSIISDSATFAPRSEIWVTKNIRVWADDTDQNEFPDSAALFEFEQRFSQGPVTEPVPEPATAMLGLLSLGGLAMASLRRRRA